MDNEIQSRIAIETVSVLKKRFDAFPDENMRLRNMPFHLAFLKAFYGTASLKNDDDAIKFLNLSHWFHGLSTTLGQKYFEKIAHILSGGDKEVFKDYFLPLKVSEMISDIIVSLKNGNREPNMSDEKRILRNAISNGGNIARGLNFTADVYIENNSEVIMIEMKTVKPNAGEMRGEKEKILNGLAYLMSLKPEKEVFFYLGFPFDPTQDKNEKCGYDKDRFGKSIVEFRKYFSDNDYLIASELWDFLSGENDTMCKLLNIINAIATTEFLENYQFVNEFSFLNYNKLYTKDAVNYENFEKYLYVLNKWNIHTEIDVAEKVREIAENKIEDKLRKEFEKLIYKKMFVHSGNYNEDRYLEILKLWEKLQ